MAEKNADGEGGDLRARSGVHSQIQAGAETGGYYDPGAMAPPIWLDEHGQRVTTRPGSKCGREASVLRLRHEHLRMNGWKPMKVILRVNWCGHGQQFIPRPEADGYCRMIPVLGEAT